MNRKSLLIAIKLHGHVLIYRRDKYDDFKGQVNFIYYFGTLCGYLQQFGTRLCFYNSNKHCKSLSKEITK